MDKCVPVVVYSVLQTWAHMFNERILVSIIFFVWSNLIFLLPIEMSLYVLCKDKLGVELLLTGTERVKNIVV